MGLLDFIRRLHKRRKLARKGFAQTKKIRRTESPAKPQKKTLTHSALVSFLMLILVWGVASFTCVYHRTHPSLDYVPGQKSNRYIQSEVSFRYEDLTETARLRDQAAAAVSPIYRIDRSAVDVALQKLAHLNILVRRRVDPVVSEHASDEKLSSQSNELEQIVAALSENHISALEYVFASREKVKLLERLVSEALMSGIASEATVISLSKNPPATNRIHILDQRSEIVRHADRDVSELDTSESAARKVAKALLARFPANASSSYDALVAVLPQIFNSNLSYDYKATEKAKEDVRNSVAIVHNFVPAGVVLLQPGERITEEDVHRLKRHQQELRQQQDLQENALDALLYLAITFIILAACSYALYVFNPLLLRHNAPTVVLVGLVLAGQILLTRAVSDFYFLHWSSTLYLYAVLPLSFGAMLLAPLVGRQTAMWAGAVASIFAAFQHEWSMEVLMIGVLSSIVAAMLMYNVRKRSHAIRAGVGVGMTIFIFSAFLVLLNEVPAKFLLPLLGLSLGNGIVVAVLTSSILPLCEYFFGTTSQLTLLELSDLNHPLLKRLQLEAPGTYHHSLMVAALAEQAAEAIGANPLLARVCAYFHDIGKLSYPEYFSENTYGCDPHQELQPRMSSLVILNHVKEGIDLALKHKLQRPIREAIASHHGTNLVYYFYRRALDQRNHNGASTAIGEQDYRYPGPLPTRKEITLISIADSCEAATRSLEKPTPQKISALVDELVLKRIRDHQLDRADLTFAELAIAKKTIIRTLGTMLHGRVQYPKDEENDEGDLFKAAAQAAAEKSQTAPAGNSENS